MSPKNLQCIVIIGTGPLARSTVEDLSRTGTVRILGAFSLQEEKTHLALGVQVLGSVRDLDDYLHRHQVDEVYLCANVGRHHEELQSVIHLLELIGMPFAVPAHVFRFSRALPTRPETVRDGYSHYRMGTPRAFHRHSKRAFDIAFSALTLVLLSPLFLVVALLIKLTSKGPVFFKQTRVGLRGRWFEMYKFRSMVEDAEKLREQLAALNEMDGPTFKIRTDPRIMPVGRFLRRFSIDEVPQLINVLKGDMSIVGPRPPLPLEVLQYAPWQRRRLSVRPGLTCFWQVEGRNHIGFEEWMYLDLKYVDQWSLRKDIGLLLRTVPAVLTGHGAS
jgi:exopolysaccharide biosynthesis polyprenyl glycosylphosphotransferase